MRRSRRARTVAVGTATTLLAFAAVAFGGGTPIDDVELEADGGLAVFDPGTFYTPVDDGEYDGASDAFDRGLMLWINEQRFRVPGNTGTESGEQLTTGPVKFAGVNVTRIDRALPDSPTLRALVKLKNPKKKVLRRTITVESNLGSDDDTVVHATSSGDTVFNRKDRWGVTTDGDVPPSDPPVTLVHYGKGKNVREKPVLQLGPGGASSTVIGDEAARVRFELTLGKRKTSYLMFFVELEAETDDAISNAAKFNAKKLSADLKDGLSKGVQKRILNWDLGKKKGKK
jgi:hypothetical protein